MFMSFSVHVSISDFFTILSTIKNGFVVGALAKQHTLGPSRSKAGWRAGEREQGEDGEGESDRGEGGRKR